MKSTLNKLVYLALIVILAASGASAATLNTATITMPSPEWETRFLMLVNELEIADPANPAFTVIEHSDRNVVFRFEHVLDLNKFIKVMYFDNGKGVFNSAALTINLDGVRGSTEPVWLAVIAAVIAGDTDATVEQAMELMNAICPVFDDVLTGKERLNGGQAATLHGVGYMMELNDSERYARFFTNAQLTQN